MSNASVGQTQLEVLPRVGAPEVLDIRLYANLSGIVIKLGGRPSSDDPLGQRQSDFIYPTLDEALADLASIARLGLQKGDRG